MTTTTEIKAFTPDTFRDTWLGYRREAQKLVIGNEDILELCINAMMADGHILLQSVPGLGKTVIGNSLGSALKGGRWGFFPFTADLLPSDVKGSMIYNEEKKEMVVKFGAIQPDMNIFVADEINRATPKTVGALLAIMEERKIVIEDTTHPMVDPSLVIGTQNPIEQEGTYPLPEAMLDRFSLMGRLDYLAADDEFKMLRTDAIFDRDPQKAANIEPVLTPADIIGMRNFVRTKVKVHDNVVKYIVTLMRSTRPGFPEYDAAIPDDFRNKVRLGGSQRTSKWLMICSRAAAAMRGDDTVTIDDVKKMFVPCVAHKLIVTPDLKKKAAQNIEAVILNGIMEKVKPNRS